MKTTLLIMAAGIGSRFGTGIKQLEPVDEDGHMGLSHQQIFLLGGSPALCQNGIEIGCDFDPIPYKHSPFPDIPFGMPYFKLFCFQLPKSMPSLMKKDGFPSFQSESCNEAY